MTKDIYDVFISYRRIGGFDTAGRINDLLVQDGYSVSYDIDTLREGRFDKQLLERVEQCVDLILIVDRNAFARTLDPATDPQDDWLRQELAYALKLKKNVIPVLLAGAEFPKGLPDDIREVCFRQGPKHTNEYFDSFYKKLKGYLHALPRKAVLQDVASPLSVHTSPLPNLKIKTDLDCVFYLDGEEKARMTAGAIKKIPLAQGEYELKFVSIANPADFLELEFEMPAIEKVQKISLCSVRDKRLQAEEEARKAEEQKRIEEQRKAEEAKRQAEEERKKAEARRIAEEHRLAEERRRAEEERARKRTFTVGGVSFTMIRVEGGTFTMGATSEQGSDAYDNEKPAHQVTLSSYFIGETEVTQALWNAVMGSNPSKFKGKDRPVECVSWDDCQEFIRKLNALTGKTFRLPTEAEWEYAARGGKKSQGYKYSGSNSLAGVAWYRDNSGIETLPVKTKSPNELGLYDMSGNVWEWCQDWHGSYSSTSQTNPTGPSSGSGRMARGGGWGSFAGFCRVSYRFSFTPDNRFSGLGFRLVL